MLSQKLLIVMGSEGLGRLHSEEGDYLYPIIVSADLFNWLIIRSSHGRSVFGSCPRLRGFPGKLLWTLDTLLVLSGWSVGQSCKKRYGADLILDENSSADYYILPVVI